MNSFGLEFHHLGLAVREASRARIFLEGLGYQLHTPVFDPEQNVNLVMATHAQMVDVEIIWSTGRAGPLDGLLREHSNGIVYHMCYVTNDFQKSLQSIEEAGLQPYCVSSPKEALLFGGRLVSFFKIKGIGLIEIIDGSPGNPIGDPALVADLFNEPRG